VLQFIVSASKFLRYDLKFSVSRPYTFSIEPLMIGQEGWLGLSEDASNGCQAIKYRANSLSGAGLCIRIAVDFTP